MDSAAKEAAGSDNPPESLQVSGVIDIEAVPDLKSIAYDIIECQKAADGTLKNSRKLLAKLYVYGYIKSLRAGEEATGETVVPYSPEEFVLSLCEILRPNQAVADEVDLEQDTFTGLQPTPNLVVFKIIARISLSILRELLTEELLSSSSDLKNTVASAVATHACRTAGWATEETARVCDSLVDTYGSILTSDDVIIEFMLKSTIKPLFGRGPGGITEQGRKAMRVPQAKAAVFSFSDEKPWRKDRPKALCILNYAVSNLKRESLERNWHLVIPPILTTLDEGDVLSKAHACEILDRVIRSVGHDFLSRTGLGSVFEEAMSPCLHFLPPLTPINHAIRSFQAGVAALVGLATHRYAGADDGMWYKAIDKILRDGVFHGMTYAGENVKMVEVFLQETGIIIGVLGVNGVKHLSKLIPFCTEPMTSPFVSTYPEVALAAAGTLVEVTRNCWPRISGYNNEILKAAVFCWIRVYEEEADGTIRLLREQLKLIMALLEKVNAGTVWFEEARNAVVSKDRARLEGLFEPCASA
ncbi:uncharacterized protein DFL_005936 [Arthrobotrys flagrans]|uniref:Uncharacterized protein n=1 Tax=Arthrobotrys flagrans TaxID=97331 RepID=A0A436ZZM5_ARTFL|nr:hypothetical protein DFL_005936 [Arthrobotrys flagrans]